MAQKQVLGKGLASLFPPQEERRETVSFSSDEKNHKEPGSVSLISVEMITPNPYQPRKTFVDAELQELVSSIAANGIIQPLIVRSSMRDGYEIIAGERRFRAALKLGIKKVPVVLRKASDREMLELALVENIQRANLNCIEEALAYLQLMEEFRFTQEALSERVGKDRTTISNYVRLLRLPEAIIEDLRSQVLSFGHGKALLALNTIEDRLYLKNLIVEKKLSVRETEKIVEKLQQKPDKKEKEISGDNKRLDNLSRELTQFFSTRVELQGSNKKGKIIIHYENGEQLDRVLSLWKPL